jgi:hypothetical protein
MPSPGENKSTVPAEDNQLDGDGQTPQAERIKSPETTRDFDGI